MLTSAFGAAPGLARHTTRRPLSQAHLSSATVTLVSLLPCASPDLLASNIWLPRWMFPPLLRRILTASDGLVQRVVMGRAGVWCVRVLCEVVPLAAPHSHTHIELIRMLRRMPQVIPLGHFNTLGRAIPLGVIPLDCNTFGWLTVKRRVCPRFGR